MLQNSFQTGTIRSAALNLDVSLRDNSFFRDFGVVDDLDAFVEHLYHDLAIGIPPLNAKPAEAILWESQGNKYALIITQRQRDRMKQQFLQAGEFLRAAYYLDSDITDRLEKKIIDLGIPPRQGYFRRFHYGDHYLPILAEVIILLQHNRTLRDLRFEKRYGRVCTDLYRAALKEYQK